MLILMLIPIPVIIVIYCIYKECFDNRGQIDNVRNDQPIEIEMVDTNIDDIDYTTTGSSSFETFNLQSIPSEQFIDATEVIGEEKNEQ